jgi:hypothetical protein
MRCRLGVNEGAVGKSQSLIDLTEHPQCEGVGNLTPGPRILAEPVGEIAMARPVVELQSLLKMVAGAGKVAEIPAGEAEIAVRDQGLGTIWPGQRFVQGKLRQFAQRCGFAAVQMPAQRP